MASYHRRQTAVNWVQPDNQRRLPVLYRITKTVSKMTCHLLKNLPFFHRNHIKSLKNFLPNLAATIIILLVFSKIEIQGVDLEIQKKKKYRKLLCWLAVDLTVAVIIFALLLYKPGRYSPTAADTDYNPKQVSKYVTHELTPQLYNGAQLGEPFEVVITQKGINEIVGQYTWPVESEGVMFYAPAVLFVPNSVVFMGTADIKGVQFVITIELGPKVDENRLLNLQATKVKVGAMNITPLAKMIAKKMYAERLDTAPVDTEDWRTKIAASLLNDEPFDPIFDVEDKKVRVDRITVANEKLILHLIPARNPKKH
jgi:hypothetical protein